MNELVERQLTAIEIRQRQVDHLRLLNEIDNYDSEVEENKRCIREAQTEKARLMVREREIRRELRSGTVWEARQVKMTFINGSTDEPAPDIGPPAPPKDDWDRFVEHWPVAREHAPLHGDLSVVLQGVNVPTIDQVREWHPDSGIFQGIAHWVRLELAHMNAKSNPGLWLPSRQTMPEPLAELTKGKAPKKKRAKKAEPEPSFHGEHAD